MAKNKSKKGKSQSLSSAEKKRRREIRNARNNKGQPSEPNPESTKPDSIEKSNQSHPWPDALPVYNGSSDYRFLNPYNFVRHLPKPAFKHDCPSTQLLGRCAPPPHDRYVGLSGTIRCQVKVVTPLFISDSHGVKPKPYMDQNGQEQTHWRYRFFQVDNQDMIPATTLRGSIRSLFEAVTNSCYSVFDTERILEYRADPKYGNELKKNGGRIQKLALPKTDNQPAQDGELRICETGTVAFYHMGKDEHKNVDGLDDHNWQSNDYVFARAYKRKQGGWRVVEIAKTHTELESLHPGTDKRPPDSYVEGWLYITGKSGDTSKKNETLVLNPEEHGENRVLSFSYDLQAEYNRVLETQVEQDDLPVSLTSKELGIGDFVWAEIPDKGNPKIIQRLARVQVPRLPHEKSIGELLPEHLHPCEEHDKLCPACRSFGWVKDAHKAGARDWALDVGMAYAGRLRFSQATLVNDEKIYEKELPIAILGSPKPTSSLFYLLKGDPEEADGEVPEGDRFTGYKHGYKLRGRKFYRHHGQRLNRQEYERAEQKRDQQNRSVRGVRKPGNIFEFTIDFHNLAEVELGALLWVLKMGQRDGCHLHIGYGKPLGFGSVMLEPTLVELHNWTKRYQALGSEEIAMTCKPTDIDSYLEQFDQAMNYCYKASVDSLTHMKDLVALLQNPSEEAPTRIHYPRPPRPSDNHKPDPEGKNFEWFVGNESGGESKEKKKGPHHALELAAKNTGGLPLLDKNGEEAPTAST